MCHLREDEEVIAESDIFIPVELEVDGFGFNHQTGKSFTRRRFYLADCEAFHGPCSVIPDLGGEKNAYFQVKPRREWTEDFKDWLQMPHKDDKIDMELLQKIRDEHKEKERLKKEKKEKRVAEQRKKDEELEEQAQELEE